MRSDIISVVTVKGLYKSFKLPHEQNSGIKQIIVNFLKRKKGYETQDVLKDVSFEVKRGDFFGIVGRNGSGKSTLLKLLAQIYTPDKGDIVVSGSLTPFIELGVGFNPELTGRENVFLNGALLGFSREEMVDMYDDIVDFAELGRFMDQKLKNYSSGMQVRLAFSIAIRARSDILLLDEVLAVGDEEFQKKCYSYFSQMKKEKRTVILVTHDMGAVERFCSKAMLIEKGSIVKVGTNTEIAQLYRDIFTENADASIKKENSDKTPNDGIRDEALADVTIDIYQGEKRTAVIKNNEPFTIRLTVSAKDFIGLGACGMNIMNSQGLIMLALGTGGVGEAKLELGRGVNTIDVTILNNVLNDDVYSIDLAIERHDADGNSTLIYQQSDTHQFSSTGVKRRKHALAYPEVEVRHTLRNGV